MLEIRHSFFVRTNDLKGVAEAVKEACEGETVDVEPANKIIEGKIAVYPVSRPTILKVESELSITVKTEVEVNGERKIVDAFSVFTVKEGEIIGVNTLLLEEDSDLDVGSVCQSVYENLLEKFGWDNVKFYPTYVVSEEYL